MSAEYWTKARGEKILPIERSLLYAMAEYVADAFNNPTIVNIGVSWGASVHCLHAGAPDARLIAIDIDLETRPVQGIEYLEDVKFVETDSTTWYFRYGFAHLAFVDGGHGYDIVSSDIKKLIPHIPLGGVIAFHDYAPADRDKERLKGVRQAVDDWRKFDGGSLWPMRWSAGSIVAFQRVK